MKLLVAHAYISTADFNFYSFFVLCMSWLSEHIELDWKLKDKIQTK